MKYAATWLLTGFVFFNCWSGLVAQSSSTRLQLKDVFNMEYASDPQISPDGKHIVYVRNFMDIMKDRRRGNLWIIDTDGHKHRSLTTGNRNDSVPRWSPDGKRLVYVSSEDKKAVLYCRWMDTGEKTVLARLTSAPSDLAWSPDGKQLAFAMFVDEKRAPFVKLPAKPNGAEWAAPAKVIRKVNYRFDGKGYLKDGYFHLFVLPAEGGTPRQLTHGRFQHASKPVWTPDGKALLFSANRNKGWEHQPRTSAIYKLTLADGTLTKLTHHKGPATGPVHLFKDLYLCAGFEDRVQGYQTTRAFTLNAKNPQLTKGKAFFKYDVERGIRQLTSTGTGTRKDVYCLYDDKGVTKVGQLVLKQRRMTLQPIVDHVGGTTIGRPYARGSYSVANTGMLAYTLTSPTHPADVAVYDPETKKARRLTYLNDDLFQHKNLGQVKEIWFQSKHDKRKIQGWIMKPPGFDPKKKYPLILEIHGGPFANYGPRFSAEMQLYAAAGYVVFYCNPRGSTGYGEEFGNLIHHAYPGHDYDDLMSGVDAVLARGYIDEDNLFVTGGSGGGVLTAWIIGMTNRFRAAVIGKPVINWFSFVLTADMYPFFNQYWFPGPPWEHAEHYFKRSPISLVGKVTTPAMILTGEADYRTPMSESEQYYQALKLRKIDTVLVRIPGASHNIAARPSQLIVKVACVLKWFNDHRR